MEGSIAKWNGLTVTSPLYSFNIPFHYHLCLKRFEPLYLRLYLVITSHFVAYSVLLLNLNPSVAGYLS